MSGTLPCFLFVMLGAFASLGCGDAGSAAPLEPGELLLGTGETTFTAMKRDEPLQLHAGTQGGHHVWLSMRASGLLPENILFELDVVPSGSAPAAHSTLNLDFVPVEGKPDTVEFVGWPARILAPECAVDAPVTLSVRLEDSRGRVATAETEVIPTAPQNGFSVVCEDP